MPNICYSLKASLVEFCLARVPNASTGVKVVLFRSMVVDGARKNENKNDTIIHTCDHVIYD